MGVGWSAPPITLAYYGVPFVGRDFDLGDLGRGPVAYYLGAGQGGPHLIFLYVRYTGTQPSCIQPNTGFKDGERLFGVKMEECLQFEGSERSGC